MEEQFDVLTEDGRATGQARPRSEVHALGLWHRAFHLFLVAKLDGVPCVLLQVRALDKDTQPGRVDVAVGGHYRAGEGLREVVREVEEELGLAVVPEELTFLWTQRSERHGPGYVDREHQDVYLLRRDAPPSAYRPDPVELSGLFALELRDLLALLQGQVSTISARGLQLDAAGRGFVHATRAISRDELVEGDGPHLLSAALASERAFQPA